MGAVKANWLIAAVFCAGASAEPQRAAQDLDYGESLYHYYTGDFPQALATLERAGSGISGHGHYPQLMRAGMYLAYGMRERAASEFAQHLGQGEPPAVRDTAHYYLAKLHYRAGDFDRVRSSLEQIGEALSPPLADDAALLRVHLAIKTAPAPSIEAAEPLLDPLAGNRYLALLNLGNSAARADKPVRAQGYYRALIDAEPPREQERVEAYLAIRDKAYTALGYSYLGQKDYASAKAAFRQVRLDTALANRALLGYGWAAASYHDYVLALKPWQALHQRSVLDPAVQESLIAVPWAYEQMGAKSAALEAYRQSQTLLTDSLGELDTRLANTDAGQVLALLEQGEAGANLSAGNSDELQNWLSLERVSVVRSDVTYLDPLLRSDPFQARAQALKDLIHLRRQQRQWRSDLAIYASLLEDKRERRRARAQSTESQGTLRQSRTLEEQSRALAEQLAGIDREGDVLALADDNTRKLARRAQRARDALDQLQDQRPLPPQAEEKLRLLSGILYWRAAQQYPANAWRARKALQQAQRALDTSAATSHRINQLLAQDPDIQGQLTRLNQLRQRNAEMLTRLDSAIDERAEQLAGTLTQQLSQHRQRLTDYLAQTRLSIARLLDDAYRAQPDDQGPQLPKVQP